MELDDKLDDTLETPSNEEDQNTEADLNDNPEPDNNQETDDDDKLGSIDGDEGSKSEEEDIIGKADLDELDDEQFTEFLETGKLPEGIKQKKAETPTEAKPPVETPGKPSKEEAPKEPTKSKGKEESAEKPSGDAPKVDYKALEEIFTKGIKANGKEIKPRNVQDVISLMQMGANYTKKMQDLKPHRKIIESLNKAEINEETLNFLIDVHKGDKEAIKKLMVKHSVDPLDLDLEKNDYRPNKNIVGDDDVEYAETLDDIQPSLPKIQEILGSKWDAKSKQMLLNNPALLRGLHEEIEMGRFDMLQAQLESEKTFGNHRGKADVEIYMELAQKFVAEQQRMNRPTAAQKPNTPKKVIPDKKEAAPNRAGKAGAQGSNITKVDLFNMSEEEFNKLSMRDLV